MPQSAIDMFRENLGFARTMCDTAVALEAQLTPAIDISDLYRFALVQGVSAFDHFVHEEVRNRMMKIHDKDPTEWPRGFARFQVSLRSVERAVVDPDSQIWLEEEIREQHGYLSFQQPDKVADALRLVSETPVWPAIAARAEQSVHDVKRQLKLIVDRRNKIAHEADIDPTPPRDKYPIDAELVRESLDYLEFVGESIIEVL